ncbi:MAG: hypothetical protein D6768_08075, partial [Chloroflexi bacterium]
MAEGKRTALIIGNSRYTDKKFRQLAAPLKDAERLAAVLQNPEIGGFEVQVLLDKESHYLRQAIESFFINAKRDDMLLLYFSGHGFIDDEFGDLYLATVDTKYHLRSTAISAAFIKQMVDRSRAEQKVLILDSCFSGAFTNEMLAKGEAADIVVRQHFGRGVAILTASTALQRAFEASSIKEAGKKKEPSVFTRCLVQGLETGEAARPDSEVITVADLFYYAEAQVRKLRPDQTPQMTIINQQGQIVIAKSVKLKKVSLPPNLIRLLNSTAPSDLLVAVSELDELLKKADPQLKQLAIEALQKLTTSKFVLVQNAAKTALQTAGQTPPPEPGPLPPAPLTRSISTYFTQHSALLAGIAILVLLAGWLGYDAVMNWLNQPPAFATQGMASGIIPTAGVVETSTPDVEATETYVAAEALKGVSNTPAPIATPTATPVPPTNTPAPIPTKTSTPYPPTPNPVLPNMVLVPAGEFTMGSDNGGSDEQPVHIVYLDAFYIDKYEVTNAQFAEFLNARGNQSEGGATWLDADDPDAKIHQNGGTWQADGGYENHPAIEMTWYGAQAYCQWAGKRLPTEAEWEKAARGTDGRTY